MLNDLENLVPTVAIQPNCIPSSFPTFFSSDLGPEIPVIQPPPTEEETRRSDAPVAGDLAPHGDLAVSLAPPKAPIRPRTPPPSCEELDSDPGPGESETETQDLGGFQWVDDLGGLLGHSN